jgi:hypothetical protein
MLFLKNKKLPWSHLKTKASILKMKEKIFTNPEYLNSPAYIKDFIFSTYDHNFKAEPDYNKLIDILSK